MIVIANVFPKLQTVKDLVRSLSTKRCFWTFFDSQHVKGCQTLVKSLWEHFYHIFSPLWGELIWKSSLLLICEILRVFVNTLTVDEKYLVQGVVRICCSRFKCNNLKNENFLAIICSISEIFIKFYKFWKKRWSS